jgi:hypothetical protein
MNIYLEVLLRTLGVFLGVFFTVGWGRKSKPAMDVFLIVVAVVSAVALAFMQPGAAQAVSKPVLVANVVSNAK